MSQLRVKIELNKGRHGIPLHRLVEVAKEAEKFFEMFADDMHLSKGEWIAENFQNGSLGYDVNFVGEITEPVITTARKALKHITDPQTTPDDLSFGIRKETFLQLAKIASPIEADDLIGIGLYNGQPEPEMRELSKQRSLDIERQIVQTVVQYGGLQGVITALFKGSFILWIVELSTGTRVSCNFPPHMYNKVWELLKARDAIVKVEGWITHKRGEIAHLDILSISEAAEYQEGDLEKFFGCDPHFTGNLNTAEYIDDLRGEITEDYVEPLTGTNE